MRKVFIIMLVATLLLFSSCSDQLLVKNIMRTLKVVIDIVFDNYIADTTTLKAKTSGDDAILIDAILVSRTINTHILPAIKEGMTIETLNEMLEMIGSLNIDTKLKLALVKLNKYLLQELNLPAKAVLNADALVTVKVYFQTVEEHLQRIMKSN